MTRQLTSAIATILILSAAASAQTAPAAPPAPATGPAPVSEPALDQATVDGLRACMSMAEGRSPADAAVIFGMTATETGFFRETTRGKIEVMPPSPDRRSCRIHVYALTLDNAAVIDAVQGFLTTPPQSFAPLQSRQAEALGEYAARTSIWAASDGAVSGGSLGLVTLYEVLANDYYLGPKIIVDYVVNRKK